MCEYTAGSLGRGVQLEIRHLCAAWRVPAGSPGRGVQLEIRHLCAGEMCTLVVVE